MFQGFIFLFSVMNDKNIETMTRKRQKVFIIESNIYLIYPYLQSTKNYRINSVIYTISIAHYSSNKEFTEHILRIS